MTDEDNEIINFDGLPLRFELAIKIFWEAPKGAGRGAVSPSVRGSKVAQALRARDSLGRFATPGSS